MRKRNTQMILCNFILNQLHVIGSEKLFIPVAQANRVSSICSFGQPKKKHLKLIIQMFESDHMIHSVKKSLKRITSAWDLNQ